MLQNSWEQAHTQLDVAFSLLCQSCSEKCQPKVIGLFVPEVRQNILGSGACGRSGRFMVAWEKIKAPTYGLLLSNLALSPTILQ